MTETTDDPYTDRLINLGKQADRDHCDWALNNCNCMIRWGGGNQMPAIRRGKDFFTPTGKPIATPESFEDMSASLIIKLMRERGESYIWYMFEWR
jgi:hypothetical protein